MGQITLANISKAFGNTRVLGDIDLDIPGGNLVVFVGPSGCGKSTLLRIIAGLEKQTGGDIIIDGRNVNHVSAADRGLAMVFQSYALYPHMSVRQNLSFGLENTKTPKAEIALRVTEAARMLEIAPYLDRRPGQLSGGQRQRVAIGRAIVRRPTAFLLDEPLSNLDAELRTSTRAEIAALHSRLATTMIYVTHDQTEAMTLADKIVVLRGGRIEQAGAPLALYNAPANQFVAGFIGSPRMNFLQARVAAVQPGQITLTLAGGQSLALSVAGTPVAQGAAVSLGIRPQQMTLGGPGAGIPARVKRAESLGAETILHASLVPESLTPESLAPESLAPQNLVIVLPGQPALTPDSEIFLSLSQARLHLFDEAGNHLGESLV